MRTQNLFRTAVLIGSLALSGGLQTAAAGSIDPVDAAQSGFFLLDDGLGHERTEFFSGSIFASEAFEVSTAGTYMLTLTDMEFPAPLRKLGAAVTTAERKLTEIFGGGTMLFDMQPGTHYLSYFAKTFAPDELGLFGLSLRPYDTGTTPVPAPAALWLFGSGLIGLMGMTRRRR